MAALRKIVESLAAALAIATATILPADSLAQTTTAQQAPRSASVDVQWGVRIAMPDGIALNATLYRPTRQPEPLPVLITQTPYTTDEYHTRAMYYAARGYVVLVVDVRGRGNSDGAFDYYDASGQDGRAVVEWAAAQAWSNGKVALWGGSFAGTNQWRTAASGPAGLVTITPRASSYLGLGIPHRGGIAYTQRLTWIANTSGRTSNEELAQDREYWGTKFYETFTQHLAYKDLDRRAGFPSPLFQSWISNPPQGPAYDRYNPTPEQLARVDLPVLTVTGYYDGSQRGSLEYVKEHLRHGPASARTRHFVVLGPWDHAGTGRPRAEVGGVSVGAASVLNINDLLVAWFDWTTKGGQRPAFLKDQVAYFVVGANHWKYANSLDAIPAERRSFFLSSSAPKLTSVAPGRLSDVVGSGQREAQYIYNPLDVAKIAAIETTPTAAEYRDDRRVRALDGDGLVYQTDAFIQPTEIAGIPEVVLFASMDVPDTDIAVSLYEIDADGASTFLTSSMLRARYRNSMREATLVPVNTVQRYVFREFAFFSRLMKPGSRIRMVVSAPNSMLLEKNYNSGGAVSAETASEARTATVRILQSARYPSALVLPVVRSP